MRGRWQSSGATWASGTRVLLDARLMAAYGWVEREGGVMRAIARRLADHSDLLGKFAASSRDFP